MALLNNLSNFDRNLIEDDSSDSDEEIATIKTIMVKNPFFSRDKTIINNKLNKLIYLNQK